MLVCRDTGTADALDEQVGEIEAVVGGGKDSSGVDELVEERPQETLSGGDNGKAGENVREE